MVKRLMQYSYTQRMVLTGILVMLVVVQEESMVLQLKLVLIKEMVLSFILSLSLRLPMLLMLMSLLILMEDPVGFIYGM